MKKSNQLFTLFNGLALTLVIASVVSCNDNKSNIIKTPVTNTIKITQGYSNGTLLLDPISPTVDQGSIIKWVVVSDPKSDVGAIKDIDKKNPPEIFESKPSGSETQWTAKVKYAPKEEYIYYIKWKHKNGTLYTFDPKISVKPSITTFYNIIIGVLGILGLFTGLGFGIHFHKKYKKLLRAKQTGKI